MIYPFTLFGVAFVLAVVALCVVYGSRRYWLRVLFLVIALLFVVAMVVFGVWQVSSPFSPIF